MMKKMTMVVAGWAFCLGAAQLCMAVDFSDGGTHNIDYAIDEGVTVSNGTTVNFVTGASVNGRVTVDNSTVNISDGTFAQDEYGYSGVAAVLSSVVTISGGAFDGEVNAESGAIVNVYGGSFSAKLRPYGGGTINVYGAKSLAGLKTSAGVINIYGHDFVVAGTSIPNSSLPVTYTDSDYAWSLTGMFQDGSLLDTFIHSGEYGPITLYLPEPAVAGTTIDIDPSTLNLNSNGKWITCYIELPEGYDVRDIRVSTVKLNGTVSAEPKPTSIGDYDDDGIADLMVKFDRAAVATLLTPGEVTVTVAGELADGTAFQGTDMIQVIGKGGKKK